MKVSHFVCTASDGKSVYVNHWLPDGEPRGLVLVAHGMSEHGQRYEGLAKRLTEHGWAIYAPDHRGHGRTAGAGELGWFSERDGFRRVVDDIHEIAEGARSEHDGLPIAIFGHCLGSLIALAYAGLYGGELSACALSGIIDEPTELQIAAGKLISALGCFVRGQLKSAELLDGMLYQSNNRGFEPARTALDWLSRDEGEVDAHFADPLCGFICSYGFFRDLFAGFELVYGDGGALGSIPGRLPMYIAAGSADPIGGARGAVEKLCRRLSAAGVGEVSAMIYPGARHELLRETNREEVLFDLQKWLESSLRARTVDPRAKPMKVG